MRHFSDPDARGERYRRSGNFGDFGFIPAFNTAYAIPLVSVEYPLRLRTDEFGDQHPLYDDTESRTITKLSKQRDISDAARLIFHSTWIVQEPDGRIVHVRRKTTKRYRTIGPSSEFYGPHYYPIRLTHWENLYRGDYYEELSAERTILTAVGGDVQWREEYRGRQVNNLDNIPL
jgi:hypothetical protein